MKRPQITLEQTKEDVHGLVHTSLSTAHDHETMANRTDAGTKCKTNQENKIKNKIRVAREK